MGWINSLVWLTWGQVLGFPLEISLGFQDSSEEDLWAVLPFSKSPGSEESPREPWPAPQQGAQRAAPPGCPVLTRCPSARSAKPSSGSAVRWSDCVMPSGGRTLSPRPTSWPWASSSTCLQSWTNWRTWSAVSRTTTLPTRGQGSPPSPAPPSWGASLWDREDRAS